jgi:hypothetical protein
MLLDLCKGLKFVIFPLQFSTILWIFAEEQYGLGGGVDEAAGVRVRHLGQGEPGPLPGRGRYLHRRVRYRTDRTWIGWSKENQRGYRRGSTMERFEQRESKKGYRTGRSHGEV